MSSFGDYVRKQQERLRSQDSGFLVRRVDIEPSYLSKIERAEQPPPSEKTIVVLAKELDADPDVLLALAGKISSDLERIIRKRPQLFSELIRELKTCLTRPCCG